MADRRAYRFVGNHLIAALILALVLTLGWTTFAYAQTSSGTQYGSRTASGETAIHELSSGASSASASAGVSSASVSAVGSSGGTGITGVLPNTGGPMIPFAVLGGLALCTTGLLVIRRLRTNN